MDATFCLFLARFLARHWYEKGRRQKAEGRRRRSEFAGSFLFVCFFFSSALAVVDGATPGDAGRRPSRLGGRRGAAELIGRTATRGRPTDARSQKDSAAGAGREQKAPPTAACHWTVLGRLVSSSRDSSRPEREGLKGTASMEEAPISDSVCPVPSCRLDDRLTAVPSVSRRAIHERDTRHTQREQQAVEARWFFVLAGSSLHFVNPTPTTAPR